ncbi:MAG: GGDEF domain-containing phosphodiesterase, partial [Eubacteriales bacterium]
AAFDTLLQRLDSNATHNLLLSNMLISHSDKTLFETLYKYRFYTLLGLAILFFLLIIIFTASKKQAMIKMVNHDNLTGLFSEYAFIQKSTKYLKEYPEENFSILSLDIDHFKHLKEMYGFDASQKVIQLVSKQLKNCFSDARVISRLNQDLFMILIPSYAIKKRCQNKMFCSNYIKEELEQILGCNFPLHTSAGIYHIENRHLRLSYMMDCANYARLRGKGSYGKTVITYTPDMETTRLIKSNVVANMEEGIARKEFVMCYQPKVDLQTQKIIGAEALVRWKRSSIPPIFPDQFISVFEQNGFIVKLDYYVFEEVCIFIQNSKDFTLPRISINISGLTLLEEDFLPTITTILKKYSIPVQAIEIEITESAIIENFDIVLKKLIAIRNYGISVSMDDFGSGVSSLHRLKDISIDVIKLDRDFLGDTLDAHKGATIIENIIHMSKQLKLKIVAEGVENEEQRKLLADMGCDYGQGYLFSKPIFENEFLELI